MPELLHINCSLWEDDTTVINPIEGNNKGCEESVKNHRQPDTINDGTIKETKDVSRVAHCPEMAICLTGFSLKDALNCGPPEEVWSSTVLWKVWGSWEKRRMGIDGLH